MCGSVLKLNVGKCWYMTPGWDKGMGIHVLSAAVSGSKNSKVGVCGNRKRAVLYLKEKC